MEDGFSIGKPMLDTSGNHSIQTNFNQEIVILPSCGLIIRNNNNTVNYDYDMIWYDRVTHVLLFSDSAYSSIRNRSIIGEKVADNDFRP